MADLNVYAFTGRLAADAEVKYSQGGTAIWTARVAVGYGWGDNKATNWITVKSLGKRAEGLAKLELSKGSALAVSGELQVREFDRKDGTKGTAVEVLANDVSLIGGRGEAGSGGGRGGAPSRERPTKATDAPSDDFASDDIPFLSGRSVW